MPIKDPIKKKEYQRNWIANKRSRQNVEPEENNFVEPLKSVEPKKVVNNILRPLPPCQICPDMNAKYGPPNKTYCLNCDLKEDNQEIVPLGLVRQLQEKILGLKEQLEAVATLPATYIDGREAELKEKHQKKVFKLESKIKDLEKKIISLHETNQILRKDLGYWQEK